MSQEQKSASGSNIISLPKGGGAIAGMGETFSPDLFTGTGNFSVPIAVPAGRNGLQPSLTLGYSTGSGNGPYGLGWNMSLPGIMRKTNLGIPRYDDEKDVFVLSGAEDLIPVETGQTVDGNVRDNWMRYQPRTEGLFARIVHHRYSDGRDYWEVRTKDGMVTWYGNPEAIGEANTTLFDPENPRHIAQWSIYRTADPFGSEVVYSYERELVMAPFAFAQLYLKRIHYTDYLYESVKRHLCSVELAYGTRPDAHSEFRQGFEIRTTRRCTHIRTYTHPLDVHVPEGQTPSGTDDNTLAVKTYTLTYRDEQGHVAHNKVSQLAQVQVTGHDGEATESLPPVEFEYQDFDITKRNLVPIKGDHLPALNLNHPDMDLVDLDGNGLPDFVQMSAGQPIRYWTNKGNGEFALPRTMRNAPTGLALGSGAVQLMDADGDGRVDLVMNTSNFAGYYSLNHDGEWDADSFRPYRTRPPLNLQSAQAQFMDLSGDGRTDVLINADRFICYFQNSPLLDANRNFDGLQFESRAIGWSEARFVNKAGLDDFPNVNFGDPRIRTADMSGDGLQDIVQVQDGNICYWPNRGYGRFGKRRQMRNSPRLGYGFNPAQLILGDADGDGQTDLIYVERNQITVWFNQSGNGFSDPVTIQGTPSFTNRDSVRMVDLFGTGTPGILWSYGLTPGPSPKERGVYLDLTGGVKPYVMVGMRNNLGARTRVQYGSSVAHYLRDTYRKPMRDEAYDQLGEFVGFAGKWKTTLPFPVQVVDRVEVIDEISKGKLTTRYFYHHGYWDGGEREFRGFGRVDQFDTETFDTYNSDSLILEADPLGSPVPLGVSVEHYAPPVLAKNWFHLGPVGAERGDWKELDLTEEYWGGDANVLARPAAMANMIANLPRRARRDAYRTLRGTALRSELYAMDSGAGIGAGAPQRPYTVSETQTGLRLVNSPNSNATIRALAVQTHSNHIFFSYGLASRSTTWERGNDPMTKFSFTGEIDAYGQPLSQVSIAVPRGKDPRTGGELGDHSGVYDPDRGYDATIQYTRHIHIDPAIADPGSDLDAIDPAFPEQYVVDRVKQTRSYEAVNDGSMSVFALRDIMLGGAPSAWTGLGTAPPNGPRLLALASTYYDGVAYDGDDFGQMGAYGVAVRTETLMVQPGELDAVYGDTAGDHPAPFFNTGSAPDWGSYPTDFVGALQADNCGYTYHTAGGAHGEDHVAGYYTSAQRNRFDFHQNPATAKGLPIRIRDVFSNASTIQYDSYSQLPVKVTDPVGMETSAEYDYRVLQPQRVTDPNGNISAFAYTPLGLMHKTALLGKDDASEGDTLDEPGVLLEYDLFAYVNEGGPVWVKTTQREHHINADYIGGLPTEEQGATIVAVEYSDGFGRQLQTRTQAEDTLFGVDFEENEVLGDGGLPANQGAANQPAVGVTRDSEDALNVVVSGAKRYNNKGKVVEQWEPYFGSGFELQGAGAGPGADEPGQRVRIYYDALGRPQRTVNPDGTEQRVVYGVPNALNTPWSFAPSPWERYTYEASDLAGLTHPTDTTVPEAHQWTPKSELIDALGRTVKTTEHNAHYNGSSYENVVMRYAYDIKGQLLEVTDPLDRTVFAHKYDTAGNNLWTEHLDSGEKHVVVDAQGKPLYSTDDKGAAVYSSYDTLHRPTHVWAVDSTVESVTLRQRLFYGDAALGSGASETNHLGRLFEQYDEAGYMRLIGYDFKGNPLKKVRLLIDEDQITSTKKYTVEWTGLDTSCLAETEYETTLEYDALNRVRKSTLPEDVDSERKELVPTYNRAGALEAIHFAGTDYVKHIAYNAKGQRVLLAMGNGMMTRYAYDALTYRLLRIRTEGYVESGGTYTPQSGSTKQDSGYVYDLGGNILKIKERVTDCGISGTTLGADALDRTFAYDPLKRLLQATGRESDTQGNSDHWVEKPVVGSPNANHTRAYERSYAYDKVGNLLAVGHAADANNYTRHYRYTSGQNLLEQLDNNGSPATVHASYTYDACGNQLTTNSDRYYEWDAADQLRLFKIDAGSGPSVEAHYFYAGGERLKKVVMDQQGNKRVTVYLDGVYEHVYTKDSVGDVQEQQNILHVMDGRSRVATVRVGEKMDDPGEAVKYNLEDHLGTSTTRLTDDGTVIDREEYYPFGESSLRTFEYKRYRYVGKELDSESGLYYYGARYYAAWVGRFVSVDPLADKYMYLTPYNYAANDPIGDFDIDGQQNNNSAPDGGTKTENHPQYGLPKLSLPGSGIEQTTPPQTFSLPPIDLRAAADETSRPGALRQPTGPPSIQKADPLTLLPNRIVPKALSRPQTVGPANTSPGAKAISDRYKLEHQLQQSLEARRALDPTAVGVAQGLITAAQHPDDVAMVILPELLLWRLQKAGEAYRIAKGIGKSDDVYTGVRQASAYLKSNGVSRARRVEWIQSFEIETLKLRQAGSSEFGLRYFDGITAFPKGRYLFETFPASRQSLAIAPQWNKMTSFTQWKIRPGATLLEGRAASQGLRLEGGQFQKFILNTELDLIKL
ncbi:MAG: VCBS repeat-containing protein [Flavobacteriales bacterium]|nr:VCBS repeat-containing protein [Flavobacteriales bacterium]MCB9178040.1 VCBS repeat-containing protein [Flavobacteriales bacterium]